MDILRQSAANRTIRRVRENRDNLSDNGPGVPGRNRKLVWCVFIGGQRGRSQEKAAGLGLAIARRHWKSRRRADWSARFSKGGLQIRIQLPITKTRRQMKRTLLAWRRQTMKKILIIEDDAEAIIFSRIFNDQRIWKVELFMMARNGLKAALTKDYDLILFGCHVADDRWHRDIATNTQRSVGSYFY